MAKIVSSFQETEDYTVDEKHRQIILTDAGIRKAEAALGVDNIYTEKGMAYVHHLQTATRAKALFRKDKEYVVKEGKVIIVDEFTGRMQPGRRWSDGLHQAIEAKEGVDVEQESKTYASITYQNYFRLYKKLSGMTGTAMTSSEEFFKVYDLDVVPVPTNEPIQRIDRNDLVFRTEMGKFKAIARAIAEAHAKGQPILVGTVSVEKSELLSMFLKKEGVRHEVLNAKNHEREGEIVANAGRKGAVTIATNMAGRGVDIKLGGANATTDEYEEVKATGGLFVMGTERHEARRIDNQLRGRSGRQGDPGVTQFFVSLDDSLMRVFANDMLKGLFAKLNIAEDEPIEARMVSRALETAQNRIEGMYFDQRKNVLEYDNVLNQQRTAIYARRRAVLTGTSDDVDAMLRDFCQTAGKSYEEVVMTKRTEIGDEPFEVAARRVALHVVDTHWMLHLETMDYLRSSVGLRAYGQREPLIEYKREGLRLFKELETTIATQTIDMLSRMTLTNPRQGTAPGATHNEQVKHTRHG
jgi:preprotein translocase subunit SecA